MSLLTGGALFENLKQNTSQAYRDYLDVQYNRSLGKYQAGEAPEEKKRKEYLVRRLAALYPLSEVRKALVVGCRHASELDLLEKAGVKTVTGIDLFSFDPRVKVMDMARTRFQDNTFDLVYNSHSLEHAFDYREAIVEMLRISKSGAVIVLEVPVNYQTQGADRYDFKSADHLLGVLAEYTCIWKVFFMEDLTAGAANNSMGTDISRLIFQIKKGEEAI